MNEDLQAVAKFKRTATILFIIFFSITLILIPLFAILFKNYWLLFGIVFSFVGYRTKNTTLQTLFLIVTIAIIIYWFKLGFRFSDQVTFFWLSFVFGYIFKGLINANDSLADKIIDMRVSEINSEIIRGVEERQKIIGGNTND